MSISALHDAIRTLLVTDAAFVADIGDLAFGTDTTATVPAAATPIVLRSYRPVRSIGQEHFPCWVIEPGDSDTTERAVGSCHQGFEVEILLALIWNQQDPEIAYNQRVNLLEVLTALFLRVPDPDGVNVVYVAANGNDRGANHPTHITTFRLLADVQVNP